MINLDAALSPTEKAALRRIAKAEPKHRRAARKAGECVRTVYVDGRPVLTEVVKAAEPAPKAGKAPRAPKAAKAPRAAIAGNVKSAVHVTVDGRVTEHRSTYAAFVALGLPENRHVKFRAELKRDGAKTFEFNGKAYAFEARIPTSGSAA